MKYSEVQALCDQGFISAEQRDRIVEHLGLSAEGRRFFAVLAGIGGVLVAAGLTLLIASNWHQIPRWVKIGCGVALLVGAHGVGYYLREVRQQYHKVGEALHLVGAGLLIANIGLIGQVYHLSSRTPNAVLTWWLGICLLPWILRSTWQHLLSLIVFTVWFMMECFASDGWLHFDWGETGILLCAALGLFYYGFAEVERRLGARHFASSTEILGLLGFWFFLYPLAWRDFTAWHQVGDLKAASVMAGLLLAGLALSVWGVSRDERLTPQWRWTWAGALAGGAALLGLALALGHSGDWRGGRIPGFPLHWVGVAVLFLMSLLQIRVAIFQGRPWMVNLGMLMVGAVVIAAYITLIGSMARTGMVFVVSGVFLLVFGGYLERKRRSLLRQMPVAAQA